MRLVPSYLFVALLLFCLAEGQLILGKTGAEEEEEEESGEVSRVRFLAHSLVALPVVVVGLVGNLLSLVVLKNMKGVMYVYLRWLAVSNLCVLLAAVPALAYISTGSTSGPYSLVFYQAYVQIPLINTFMASSVYIIICMTINRFCSIWKPTLFKEFYTTRNALLSVTCCFVFGMIFHIPLSFQNKVVPVNFNVNGNMSSTLDLYESKENGAVTASCVFKSYILISEVFLRFGPILVLTVLNPLIICKFRKVSRNKDKVRGKQAAAVLSLHHNGKTAKIRTHCETPFPQRKAKQRVIEIVATQSLPHALNRPVSIRTRPAPPVPRRSPSPRLKPTVVVLKAIPVARSERKPPQPRKTPAPSAQRRPPAPPIQRQTLASTLLQSSPRSTAFRDGLGLVQPLPLSDTLRQLPPTPDVVQVPVSPNPDKSLVPRQTSGTLVPRRTPCPLVPRRTQSILAPDRNPSPIVPNRIPSPLVPRRASSPLVPNRTPSPLVPNRTPGPFVPNRTPSQLVPRQTSSLSVPRQTSSPRVPNQTPSRLVPKRTPSPLVERQTPRQLVPRRTQSPTLSKQSPTRPEPEVNTSAEIPPPSSVIYLRREQVRYNPADSADMNPKKVNVRSKMVSLRLRKERMMVGLLVALVLLFLVCTTPAAILSLIYTQQLNNNYSFQLFRAVANTLELLNFTLNFYISCLCSSDIRAAFIKLFRRTKSAWLIRWRTIIRNITKYYQS